jgi:hypothetical protein
MTDAPSAVYVLPGKIGGVLNFVDNLLAHRRPDGWKHWAILTRNRLENDTPFTGTVAADLHRRVEYSLPVENLYSVLRRLARAVPPGPGVLVANDWLELAMLAVHPVPRTVVSITHGDFDYYYDLAERHEPLIDCFVTYTRRMYDQLAARLREPAALAAGPAALRAHPFRDAGGAAGAHLQPLDAARAGKQRRDSGAPAASCAGGSACERAEETAVPGSFIAGLPAPDRKRSVRRAFGH